MMPRRAALDDPALRGAYQWHEQTRPSTSRKHVLRHYYQRQLIIGWRGLLFVSHLNCTLRSAPPLGDHLCRLRSTTR